MPAVGKITLDVKDYEKALAQARQSTAKFAGDAKKNMQDVSKGVSKAGTVVSAMGSAAGSSFGKLGGMISALASGPVAALTAAIGTMAALAVDLWDKMTLSAEEYAHKLDLVAQEAEKNRDAVEKQAAEDAGYMERLAELARKETLSNEAKTEAATLIKNLSARYGDLGLAIDDVTGRITGMDKAQGKFLEKVRQNRMKALREELNAVTDKAENAAAGAVGEKQGWFSRAVVGTARDEARALASKTVRERDAEGGLRFAREMRNNANTQEDMDKWQKVIDLLEKRKRLELQLKGLQETGSASEKENAERQKKKTAAKQAAVDAEVSARNTLEKKTDDYYAGTISNMEKQLEIQRLINAGKLEEAERQKRINELQKQGIDADARMLTIDALTQQLNAAKLTQAQGQQAESLYDRALRAAGRTQEADTRAALANAKKAKGGELTEDEKTRTLELLDLTRQLDENRGASFGNLAVQTNSLTARGGFASGAVVPDSEKYAKTQAENGKSILNVVQRIETICRDFGKF